MVMTSLTPACGVVQYLEYGEACSMNALRGCIARLVSFDHMSAYLLEKILECTKHDSRFLICDLRDEVLLLLRYRRLQWPSSMLRAKVLERV